jgi:hypothetical protein
VATFGVSRAWVHRLVQRRRETGSIEPRTQTKFRSRVLAGQEPRLAALIATRSDATLAELREALPTLAALSTLWLEIDRLGLTVKKNVWSAPICKLSITMSEPSASMYPASRWRDRHVGPRWEPRGLVLKTVPVFRQTASFLG